MKVIKFLLLVLTIAVAVIILVFFATQYAKFDKNDSSLEESSDVSSDVIDESEHSESSEEPTVTPEPTKEPTPSPTVKPEVTATPKPTTSPSPTATSSKEESSSKEDEDDENDEISIYSMPTVGESKKFQNEFKDNEIDTNYIDDMFIASSTYIMKKTVSDAMENWEFQINSSLNKLKNTLSSDDYQKVKDNYDDWEDNLDSEKQDIYDKYSDSGSFGAIDADYEIMLLYREKAAELKEIIYDETGELEFEDSSTAVG